MTRTPPLHLGDTAADTITRFTGVVTSIHTYLHGCRRITLDGVKTDAIGNTEPIHFTFDEPQLELVVTNTEAAARIAAAKTLTGDLPG